MARAARPPACGCDAVADREDQQRRPSRRGRRTRRRTPAPRRFCWLLEQERHLDRMRALDVHGQVPGRRIGGIAGRFGGLCHCELERAREDIVAHESRALQLQKKCPEISARLFAQTHARRGKACLRRPREPLSPLTDAAGPGADGGVAAAVGMEDGQRVRRARLAVESPPARRRARSAPRRCGRRAPETRRAASCPASPSFARSRVAPCSASTSGPRDHDRPDAGQLDAVARRSERLLDERRVLRRSPSRGSSATRPESPPA